MQLHSSILKISKGGILLLVISILLVFICGIGGFFPQSGDLFIRNAIYRDLILKPWPVVYEQTNRALVYYFGYWMVPAAVCKLFLPFLSEYAIWNLARTVLALYTVIFLLLVFLMLCLICQTRSGETISILKILKVTGIFCSWGGVVLLGVIVSARLGLSEWFHTFYEAFSRPLTTEHYVAVGVANGNVIQVMNVFNQSLPAWLATELFLGNRKNISLYGTTCFSLALLAPFPMLGIAAMMFIEICFSMLKKDMLLKNIFCIENILSTVFVFIIGLFYRGGEQTKVYIKPIFQNLGFWKAAVSLSLFAVVTFGIYAVFIFHLEKNYFLFICLAYMLCCFISVGSGTDFTMRATIPFHFYMMALVIRLLVFRPETGEGVQAAFVILLSIAAVVPICTVSELFYRGLQSQSMVLENDSIYSLDHVFGKYDSGIIGQYTKLNPMEDFFFAKLTNLDYELGHPVIDYAEDDGALYVAECSLTRSCMNEFFASVIIGENEKKRVRGLCKEDKISVISFQKNKVFPRLEDNMRNVDEHNFTINWSNYREHFSADQALKTIRLIMKYSGVEPIQIYMEKYPKYQSGIVAELWDANGELIEYTFAYSYTRHVVYQDDTEEFILYINMPNQEGNYKVKFGFFFNDANGNYNRIYDGKEYCVKVGKK